MAWQEGGTRLRLLGEAAAEFRIDSNIPIRRYFRSGQEMIKMAEVYNKEGSQESAFVLYMKYMTLFVEKLKTHRDFSMVLPAEKKKVFGVVKEVMGKTEELKVILKRRFDEEHSVWLRDEQRRVLEEQREQQRREEQHREAERKKKEEMASIERDRQVAMWHQAQLDKEDRVRRGVGLPGDVGGLTDGGIEDVPQFDPYNTGMPAYDPSKAVYDSSKYTDTPSAPPPSDQVMSSFDSHRPGTVSPPPSYDRAVKPAPTTSSPSPPIPTNASPMPTFDRSAKPNISAPTGLRTVVVPSNLEEAFLSVAKVNSDRGVETLGTLGGHLSNNRFIISHLLIPKQEGKSDSCTMEGLEDVWDVHDKENIIFLGWVHTHPAYSVFLSSVDMHNQYEWQHMLPEALAIVCSIKDGVVGNLRLTEAGMSEIGGCNLTNFHPHSKEPPLWEEASHVEVDRNRKVVLKDLR